MKVGKEGLMGELAKNTSNPFKVLPRHQKSMRVVSFPLRTNLEVPIPGKSIPVVTEEIIIKTKVIKKMRIYHANYSVISSV